MKRRDFIHTAQLGSFGILLSPLPAMSTFSQNKETTRIVLKQLNFKSPELPDGQRIPFGWSAAGLLPGDSVIVKPDKKIPDGNLWFRVSVAQEIWDKKQLHLQLANSKEKLGTVDIQFSSVLVPYEVKINKKYIPEINRQGIKITLESPTPFWYFNQPDSKVNNAAFLPHLLSSQNNTGTIDDFLNCFLSINSTQAFGWREGTVLDGLWQIFSKKNNKRAFKAIQQHFDLYFDKKQNLVYENARSKPNDNRVNGIESTIPFATLARLHPEHPILKTVVKGWQEMKKENGMVIDGTMVSAEGCYTVAYPMAVIGKIWQDKALKENALEQLKHRYVLINDNKLNLRYYTEGRYTYPNWARGAAWTLLGFSRTISELMDEMKVDEIIDKFEDAVKIAVSMQRKDGLWNCFMHEPNSLPDTSGSAGISAAILTGINNGFLSESYRSIAEGCWSALENYITPDGFLKGVAQDNRGGVELQQSDYRVIAQMGMGMMAQLYAER
ncbi:hypothetical protein GM418_00705 [Maribellus comscasis]|uniref:Glucuronyl hydrolase n=1 Tax=Maribellus comscasis TaxID=2681766 RepID=A0A6I6JHF9_9BACT|nr:glycoside hydrolase family 88 protein [Maribellus comscasis]QGY42226.1 hypothetical protein GM418_00705 [Maribellus comscasis]